MSIKLTAILAVFWVAWLTVAFPAQAQTKCFDKMTHATTCPEVYECRAVSFKANEDDYYHTRASAWVSGKDVYVFVGVDDYWLDGWRYFRRYASHQVWVGGGDELGLSGL